MENNPICRYREQIDLIERAANVSTNNIEVAKSIITKAIKYADTGQLCGIASDCYQVTHDKA